MPLATTATLIVTTVLAVLTPPTHKWGPPVCVSYERMADHLGWLYDITPKVDGFGDFAKKDHKAAERLGMTTRQYVVDGMGEWFVRRIYLMVRAMEEDGLRVGITSAYRDDWRQGITAGKNRNPPGRSYHGGSLVGGYGHGEAIDIVALADNRDEQYKANGIVWAWIDRRGAEFGLGRPYLNGDPPHVAPIDGREWALNHPRALSKLARAAHKRHAKRHHSGKKRFAKHRRHYKKVQYAQNQTIPARGKHTGTGW